MCAAQILGAMASTMKSGTVEMERMHIFRMIVAIRSMAWTRGIPIVMVIEGNLNQVMAESAARYVENEMDRRVYPVRCIRTTVGQRSVPYIWLPQSGVGDKQRLVDRFGYMLGTSSVFVCSSFATVNGTSCPDPRKALMNQLTMMRVLHKAARDEFGKGRSVVTGKAPGQNDDLAMALLEGVLWGAADQYSMARAQIRTGAISADSLSSSVIECAQKLSGVEIGRN